MDAVPAFEPSEYHPLLKNGHCQTLYAWARRRTFPRLPEPAVRYFHTAADACVLGHCHWHDAPSSHPTLILLHGLEGSSLAHYMCGVAEKAWIAGWNVVRLNQRNCGGTEHLSRGLYHSGLTDDPRFVVDTLIDEGCGAIVIAGYSLGGNLALKLAGELGDGAPPQLKAVCAVSPTIDLSACVTALERRSNVVYQWNFVRNLKDRMRRKAAAFPDGYSLEPLGRIRTIRAFDEAYTAPHHRFRDADDYYYRASALRVTARITVPTLIICSEDDPFVPPAIFGDAAVRRNESIVLALTRAGGHCAFVERRRGDYDGYWAEREIVRFATTRLHAEPFHQHSAQLGTLA